MLSRYLNELCTIATQFFPTSIINEQKKRLAYSLMSENDVLVSLSDKLPIVNPHHDLPLLNALLAMPTKSEQQPAWHLILDQLAKGLNALQGLLERYPDALSHWRQRTDAEGVVSEVTSAHETFKAELESVIFSKSDAMVGIQVTLTKLCQLLQNETTHPHQLAMLQAFQNKFSADDLSASVAEYFVDIERYADNLTAAKSTREVAQQMMGILQENMQTLASQMEALTDSQDVAVRDALHQRELKALRRQISEMELKQAAMTAQHDQVVGALVSELALRDSTIQALKSESDVRAAADENTIKEMFAEHTKEMDRVISAHSELEAKYQTSQDAVLRLGESGEKLAALEQTYKTLKASHETVIVENRKLGEEVQRSRKIVSETVRRAFCLDVTLNEVHFKSKARQCLSKFTNQMPSTPDKSFIPREAATHLFDASIAEAETVLASNNAIRALELYISAYKIAGKHTPKQKKTGLFTPNKKQGALSQRDIARNKIIELFKEYFASMPTKKGFATRLDSAYTWRLGDCLNILVQLPSGIDPIFDLCLYPDVLFNLLEHALDKLEKGSRQVKPDQVINLYRWIVRKIATLYIDADGFDSLKDMDNTLQEDYLIADYVERLDIILEKLTNVDSTPSPAKTYKGLLSKPAVKRALPVIPDDKPVTIGQKTTIVPSVSPDTILATDTTAKADDRTLPSPVHLASNVEQLNIPSSVTLIGVPTKNPEKPSTRIESHDRKVHHSPSAVSPDQPEPVTPPRQNNPTKTTTVVTPPPMPPAPKPAPNAPPMPPAPKIKQKNPAMPMTPAAKVTGKDANGELSKPNNAPSTPLQNKHLAAIRAGVKLSKAEFISPSKRSRKPTGSAHAVALMNKINEFTKQLDGDMRSKMSKRYEAMHGSDNEDSGWESDNSSTGVKFELPTKR